MQSGRWDSYGMEPEAYNFSIRPFRPVVQSLGTSLPAVNNAI